MNPDRIEKQVLLRASLDRVWRALSDATEFGAWFGLRVDGPFEPGRRLTALITPTVIDAAVAEMQKPYEGTAFEMMIERVEPERLLSFRWTHPEQPGAAEAPATLVVFTLEERQDGVLLTVTESGFEQIPVERRAKLFTGNEQGWAIQIRLIEKYLVRQAQFAD
jgi:uncharacterized protein YndB with AHSA1/START domain